MALPNIYRLNRCCGCLSLQKGSIVIGTVGMLMILILICWQLVLIVVNEQCYRDAGRPGLNKVYDFKHYNKDDDIDDHDDDDDSDHMSLKEFSYMENPHKGKNIFECPHWIKYRSSKYNYNTARFILGMTAVMLCIYFFLIALMVHGVRTARPNMMAPCLMWTLVHIVFAILTLIGIGHLPPSDVISELFCLGLLTYFFCVVNSYYHQLRESENGGAGALVVAMSRQDRNNLNTSEMFVTIPSPRKADLPPPYPGMDNPNYSPYLSNAATGMGATSYASPSYHPPGYGDICGGTSDSLAMSLPPPPAYSFINNNNFSNTESQALSPPPPLGFAGASQDVLLRAENTSSIATQNLSIDGNINNGRANCHESGNQGVVSDTMMPDDIVMNTPMTAIATAETATASGTDVHDVADVSGSTGKNSSMARGVESEDMTTPRTGFVNPAYDGCDPKASAAVLPPPQSYGVTAAVLPPPQQYGDEDCVQDATAAVSETTESQIFNNNYPTSKI